MWLCSSVNMMLMKLIVSWSVSLDWHYLVAKAIDVFFRGKVKWCSRTMYNLFPLLADDFSSGLFLVCVFYHNILNNLHIIFYAQQDNWKHLKTLTSSRKGALRFNAFHSLSTAILDNLMWRARNHQGLLANVRTASLQDFFARKFDFHPDIHI